MLGNLLNRLDGSPCPLVVRLPDSPSEKKSSLDSLFFYTEERLATLRSCQDSREVDKTEAGEYVVVEALRRHLNVYKNRIDIPFYSTRIIYRFSPFVIYPQDEDKELTSKNAEAIRELRLAKCIVCLQFLANPNLPASDRHYEDNAKYYMLGNIFSSQHFNQEILNLLFSYGLKYSVFYQAFKEYLREVIRKRVSGPVSSAFPSKKKKNKIQAQAEQCWSSLDNCLKPQASPEEKSVFAQKYGISLAALDVADNNAYIQCYTDLQRAYEAYEQGDYQQAKTNYDSAEKWLIDFQSAKQLSPLILKDYNMRASKCAEYRLICAQKQQTKTFSMQRLLSQCFYKPVSEEQLRLSDETSSLSSDEGEKNPLLSQRVKCKME